jgi:hypothetical protein
MFPRDRLIPGFPRRRRIAGTLLASVALAATAAANAGAASPIERVWSFNAGKIAVAPGPNGALTGTVVAPTKFTQCTHPVGEEVWTGMRERSDGSFWGFHRWYFATEACVPNPVLGLTAWRVLRTSAGGRFLRVCFSEPGSTSQPMIAPDGTTANATFGCSDSALVAALPSVTQQEVGRYLRWPGSGNCLRRSKLVIRIHDPENDPFTKVVVKLRSGGTVRAAKLHRRKATTIARLNLTGLAQPTFTVTINLTTALGEHLRRKRTYALCPSRRHHRR